MKTLAWIGTIVLSGGVLFSYSNGLRKRVNSQSKSDLQATADGLVRPEIVRPEGVHIANGVKMVTVGNGNGHYQLACNTSHFTCITPLPGNEYYVFTKTTRWRFPGCERPGDT